MNAKSNALETLVWLFAVLLPACAVAQIPEGWEIIEIFPAGTEYYCGPPDINERGQIVFHRRLWPSLTEIEIMLYDRGKLIQLTDDDVYDSFPRINNHAEIVWSRDTRGLNMEADIVLWRDGSLKVIADESYSEVDADINNAGQIVWDGNPHSKYDQSQVYLYDGSRIVQITNDSFVNVSVRINEPGSIVFTRYDFSVSPWVSQILAYSESWLKALTTHRQVQLPHLNDVPQVVWTGDRRAVLEMWQAGRITTVVQTNAFGAHINNHSEICFGRWDAFAANTGLWLIRQGKLMQLTDGFYGGAGTEINNRGEIAFMHGRHPSFGISLFTKPSFVADLDFDGDVDVKDFAVLQACFGGSISGIAESCSSSDINGDGLVDGADIRRFAEFLGGPE